MIQWDRLPATAALVGLLACGAPSPSAPPAPVRPIEISPSASTPGPPVGVEPPTAVRVALCGVTGGAIHLYTAADVDLFGRHGLRAEVLTLPGSTASFAAMGANEVQFVYCAAEATLPALASGAEAKIIGALQLGLPYLLVAQPDVRTVADLRGKTIGIPRAGLILDSLSRLALERHGLRANQDTDIRPVGGNQVEAYQALVGGVVQASVISPPLDVQATRQGLRVIYDMADLGLPAVFGAVHASNRAVQAEPRLVQRFVEAMADSVHYVAEHPEQAKAAMAKVLKVEDTEALDAAYRTYSQRLANPTLRVPVEALNLRLDDLRASGANVVVRAADEFTTNAFAEQMDQSGYLRRLWGDEPPWR